MEQQRRDASKFITLRHGEHAILKFDVARTVYKMDTYQGQETSKKYWFTARQLDCTNDEFRTFKPNEKSGANILEFLKVNKTNVARIDRTGDAQKPVYQPSLVSDEDIRAVDNLH